MLEQKIIEIKGSNITHFSIFIETETGDASDYTMDEFYESIQQSNNR